jgi:hypothetical protein
VLLFFLQRHATRKGCQQPHVLLQGMTLRIVLQEATIHQGYIKLTRDV